MNDEIYDVEAEGDLDDDLSFDDEEFRSRRRRGEEPGTEGLLLELLDLLEAAKPIPLSASARINNKEEVVALLQEAISKLPEELKDARWLLKQRADYLAKIQHDADDLTRTAQARVAQMVQRTEVVKAAEVKARKILTEAEGNARRLRLECEDYCDQRLATFEIVLERTLDGVSKGREKMQASMIPMAELDDLDDSVFFEDND
ncbi:MAG: hypothetical protein H6519_02855 [Microthrixaceae bacterium]|nr:hypothetical protein [Acidimicrobiales bacterium]MCB9403352.1 hypothetical protein [Microthrixaceae bacterium]